MAVISKDLAKACELLSRGEVIAIPTETVYGLAGNYFNSSAIEKIYAIKNRPRKNPLIMHVSGMEQLMQYVDQIPENAMKLADEFWPGPLTLLLPKGKQLEDKVNVHLTNIAIRVPAHPLTLELLKMLPFPLAAPSANPYGYISPTNARHVHSMLGEKIDFILDGGDCSKGLESTIVGFEAGIPVIYREGMISREDIIAVTGEVKMFDNKQNEQLAPGMSKSHYSPRTRFYLTNDILKVVGTQKGQRLGLLCFQQYYPGINKEHQVILSADAQLEEAAKNLYEALHHLDSLGLDLIIGEWVPDEGIGRAINDRLKRAAHEIID
jgi:L-threonylcarbamoyladenylate synthase